MSIPDVHLLVVGPQAPNLVPDMVTKIRHLPENKDAAADKVYEAIEDAIARDTCTHVLMAAKAGGETSPVLIEANKRFVGALVPNVVGVESRGKGCMLQCMRLVHCPTLIKLFVSALCKHSCVCIQIHFSWAKKRLESNTRICSNSCRLRRDPSPQHPCHQRPVPMHR